LMIDLKRELPEALKPRSITIGNSPLQIALPVDDKKAA